MKKFKFTLIELLLVIIILAVVATFITPLFRFDGVESTLNKFISLVSYTRQLAVTNKKDMECVISLNEIAAEDNYRNFEVIIRESGTTGSFLGTKKFNFHNNTEMIIDSNAFFNGNSVIIGFDSYGEPSISSPDFTVSSNSTFSIRNIFTTDNKLSFQINNFNGKVRRL